MRKKLPARTNLSAVRKLMYSRVKTIIAGNIPLEVDLENRQIFFDERIKDTFQLDQRSNNIDSFINTYVDPADSKKVIQSLSFAGQGLEQPFRFNFIHPLTERKLQFEYRYQIIYHRYACTRLRGELVQVGR